MKRLILIVGWLIFEPAGSFAQVFKPGRSAAWSPISRDLPVPGVTITATSPALQGPRLTFTDKEEAVCDTRLAARREFWSSSSCQGLQRSAAQSSCLSVWWSKRTS